MEKKETRVSFVGTSLQGYADAHNFNEVHIQNNRIIRIRPYHFNEKLIYRIKAKSKIFTRPAKSLSAPYELSFKHRAFSSNRVKYPLKRIDFDPKGERNPQNRGKSKFVRISWEEALNIIVGEINRIKEKYGLHAIAVMGDGHGQSSWQTLHYYAHKLFDALGGCTHIVRNPDSWEGYYWGAKHVWGGEILTCGWEYQDAIYENVLENTELLIITGGDPETTSWGFGGQLGSICMRWIKDAGIKCIFICPNLNYSAAIHADKWIPIRPNTDSALYLAIAYLWITEGTYDEGYVKTHVHGFEDFKRYILGEEDGIPKTPEWASKITGIPVRTIKALARTWASKRTSIAVAFGGPKIRGPYSTEPARLEAILLGMQGLGKPGVHFVTLLPDWALGRIVPGVPTSPEVYPGLRQVLGVRRGIGMPRNPCTTYATAPLPPPFIPKTLLPDAILNPPITWYGTGAITALREDQFEKFTYPMDGYPEIRMIVNENGCWTTCWNEGYKFIEAIRSPKIEFVLVIHPWFENDCAFADIILPATTVFEQDDFAAHVLGEFTFAIWTDKCIEPIGESKSDYEIMQEIALRLGVKETFPPFEDFVREAYEESLCPKYMSWEEFKKNKVLIVPSPSLEEWEEIKKKFDVKPGLGAFYEDPVNNRLETPTGKLEFYSTGLAEHFPGDTERPPIPHYIPCGETHKESLLHPRAKKYPLLMVSNHPRWRVHAQCDDIPWLREIPTCKIRGPDDYYYEPLWIHPSDAAKRGIKHGDIVKVYNERGAVLGAAYVTERIMPGVVSMDHGARVDLISIEDRIDRGGAINLICPSKPTSKNVVGMVVSAFLVEVEKVDLDEVKQKYPEAFERPYDSAHGLCYKRWVIE
ncbi:MAG: molybdopterin-dependent oxidoreductase [Candidatus Bathyarchaeia archaeon]